MRPIACSDNSRPEIAPSREPEPQEDAAQQGDLRLPPRAGCDRRFDPPSGRRLLRLDLLLDGRLPELGQAFDARTIQT
jgi:hypothetical protein